MSKKKKTSEGGRAVIYARYSSNNQREESIEQQVKKCEEFAARKGYTIVDTYSDAAISGKTDNRPAFQRMLRDSKKGGFQFVIAWKSNRIGRNMMQALTNEAKFLEAGVRCVYVEEYFDDSASGRFALRNMMNVNQFYIENMAEDIRRGLLGNAEKCLANTRAPYGYKIGEDRKYIIDEETAPVVQEIFQKYLDGWAYIDIANELNRRGLKTVLGNDWNKGSFHSMLRNEMYTGVYIYSEVRIEGGMPAIIDRMKFEEVQRKLSAKRPTRGRKNGSAEYLLTGKLYCGHCGEPMVGISGTGRHGETHYYYQCQGRRRQKNGCEKKNAQRDVIENAVFTLIREFIMSDEILDHIVEDYHKFLEKARQQSTITAMTEQLAQNKKASANLLKALESGIVTDMIQERLRELETERKDLEYSINFEKAALVELTPDQLLFTLTQLRNSDFDNPGVRRELVDLFVRKIYLFDDRLKIVFNFDSGGDHEISFAQTCEGDESEAVCSYKLPSSVLSADDTNPVTVTVFAYGLVLSATF